MSFLFLRPCRPVEIFFPWTPAVVTCIKFDRFSVPVRLRGNRAMIAPDLGAVLSLPHIGTRARLPGTTAPRGLQYLNLLPHTDTLTVYLVHFPYPRYSLPFAFNW
jgi:hypothetical protein